MCLAAVGSHGQAARTRGCLGHGSPPLPEQLAATMHPGLHPPVSHTGNTAATAAPATACRFDEIKPKVYERLLRKLLNKPNKPAVVLLQLMPKGMAYAPTT